jgi:LPPG:FO 2-phospho-L-lactate transferase
VRTHVLSPAGRFPFQEWFVARRHADEVDGVEYEGAERAHPAPGVLEAIGRADLVVVAPSNPYVSIGPIVAVAAIRDALERRRVPCVAVSPLIGGAAVKGPVDRMLSRMAGGTTPAHVAGCYAGLIDALVIDEADSPARAPVRLVAARTLMSDRSAAARLAEVVLGVTA